MEEIVKNNDIDRIDFLKIDTEGSEFDILFACPVELLHSISKICMECHRDIEGMKKYLESNGFYVRTNIPNSMLFARNISIDI